MKNKTLLIDREKFCDWYFDYDTCKEFFERYSVFTDLLLDGKFEINLDDILENVGYLPEDVIADNQKPILDKNGEIKMDAYKEIKFTPLNN